MSSHFGKVFNALTGLELRKKILHDLEVLLDEDDRFRHSQTYPKVKFDFRLTVEVYPAEPQNFDVSFSREYIGEGGEQLSVSHSAEFVQERVPDRPDGSTVYLPHPDKIRQEIGAPIPSPQKVRRVGVVDLTGEQLERAREEPQEEPLIIPATEIPEGTDTGNLERPTSRDRVTVGGRAGARQETVEIAGHSSKPRPVEIPHTAAVKISINNPAAVDDNWAERELGARPVAVDDKSR